MLMRDITLWQLVGFESWGAHGLIAWLTDKIALSGASATIASDALMNPFDGMCLLRTSSLTLR